LPISARRGGNALTDAVLDWAASRAAAASQPLRHLLRAGEGRDAVPLGLVAGLLATGQDGTDADERQQAREALIRLEPRLRGRVPAGSALGAWGTESAAAVLDLLGTPAGHPCGEALLARSDQLLDLVHGIGLAGGSDLLPSGLTWRLAALARVLRSAPRTLGAAGPDDVQITPAALADVEQGWASVATHRLADTDARMPAFRAAVRLARWLALDTAPRSVTLPVLLAQYRDAAPADEKR
jgi:hypothetical protein